MEVAVVDLGEDDDNLKSTQPLIDDILKGVTAYVDVRSGHDNRTKGISLELELMGATVSKTFNKKVTHVVFNEGSKATFEKAKRLNLPLLSALWVDSCKKNGVRVSENFFPAFVSEVYHSKIVKLRKLKSMQPIDLDEAYERSERILKRRKRREQRKKFEERYASAGGLLNNMSDYNDEYDPNEDFYKIDLPNFRSAPTGLVLFDSTTDDDSDEENEKIPNLARRLFDKMPDSPVLQEAFARGLKFRRSKTLGKPAPSPMAAVHGSTSIEVDTNTSAPNLLDTTPTTDLQALSLKSVASTTPCGESEDLFGPPILVTENVGSGTLTPRRPRKCAFDSTLDMEVDSAAATDAECSSTITTSMSAVVNPMVEVGAFNHLLKPPDGGQRRSSTPKSRRGNVKPTTPRVTRRSMAVVTPTVLPTVSPQPVEDDIFERGCGDEMIMPYGDRSAVTTRRNITLSVSKLLSPTIHKSVIISTVDIPVSPIQSVDVTVQPTIDTVKLLTRGVADSHSRRRLGESGKKKVKATLTQSKLNFHSFASTSVNTIEEGSKKRKLGAASTLPDQPTASTLVVASSSDQPTASTLVVAFSSTVVLPKSKGVASVLPVDTPLPSPVKGLQRRSLDDFQLEMKKPKRVQSTLLGFCRTATDNTACATKHIVLTSFSITEKEMIIPIIRKLGGTRIGQKVDGRTTHVVCGDVRRTLSVLMGTVQGCWLLNSQWIYKSLELEKWEEEESYELSVAHPTAKVFRMERMLDTGFGYRCRLFHSVPERIYVNPHTVMPHMELEELLKLAGAKVTRSVKDAKLVIGSFLRGSDAPCLPEKWVLDSISQNKILPYDEYFMSSLSPAYS